MHAVKKIAEARTNTPDIERALAAIQTRLRIQPASPA
jgi:hypothetical protein